MASNYPLCAVCDSLNVTKTSVVWCSECDQTLCNECVRRHSVTNATKGHKTVDIDNYSKLPHTILQTSQTCPDHNKGYQKYCTEHESLCCIDCVLSSHRGCHNIQNIDDVVRNVNKSHVLLECDDILDEIKENITEVIKCRHSNGEALKTQRSQIENEIKSIRQKINNHLDKVENDLMKKLHDLEQKESLIIKSMISELKTKEASFEKLKSDLKSLKEHASNLQLFLAMKDIEKETKREEEFVKSLYDSTKLNKVSLTLTPTVTSIESLIPSIGTVHVTSNPHNLQYTGRQQKQAQHIVPRRAVRLEEISLTLSKEVKVDIDNNLGCTLLDDKKYAISSFSNKAITVIKPDGSVDFQIDTNPHNVIDIVYQPSSRKIIATADIDSGYGILIIDVDSRKISRSIPVNTINYGITLHHDNVVYCATDRGLMRMDIKDHTITAIDIEPMSVWSYIASFHDNLYYTHKDNDSVTCCEINGQTKWEFKDSEVLRSPHGICVDGDGFVYVVGLYSNNVVVISPGGLHHAVLLTSNDGLVLPLAIDYDKKNDVLLVVNQYNNALIFKVTK